MRTPIENQAAAIQAVKLQREALRLSRHAYLNERGAGELVDAAAKIEEAAFLLREIVRDLCPRKGARRDARL